MPLTIGTWAQYILDTCGTVEEAIAAQESVRIEDSAPPTHFLIADASGNGAAFEWFDGQFVCRRGDTLPIEAMSNMPYEAALIAFRRGGHPWWKWSSNPGQSAERFAAAHKRSEYFETHEGIEPIRYAFDTLTRFVAAGHTQWNVVFRLSSREIWFRSVRSPTVKSLKLSDCDFSCGAPLLMLDVNTVVEGDVREAFEPFDYATNQSMFQTLCARYQLEVTEEAAQDLMRHFEGFECASAGE